MFIIIIIAKLAVHAQLAELVVQGSQCTAGSLQFKARSRLRSWDPIVQ